ncbi:uncharacterized protein BCR38DRAFT_404321 [Pseudomassariella vexata]|uniref:DNA (cytosine-5)-methyltransferase 1 replication foci domain-containing protein n=1 Tax=Pseudomassariella vexata TaxID=1141098 RepID=A0A1Y2EIZ0_9PEZI|nr:uncharacterized protein BCR38DRAFT_404321 [Pseudomassariella vexata]ORY71206.1 hypothetical protein BCR38DRAFT_404321 [Pseudomassariella vexata]
MAGRRRARAASISTVATVNQNAIRYQKESAVLKPVNPSLHPDDWPSLVLNDATVYRRDGTVANLLNMDLEGPFIIRGMLELDEDQKHLHDTVVKGHSKSTSAWIEVYYATQFSIGENDEQIPITWALGESGWFEIVPSIQYAEMYKFLAQGISLHYGLLARLEGEMDTLKRLEKAKPKKQRRKINLQDVHIPIDELLLMYAIRAGDGSTQDEVVQRCKDHAPFLISHFPKGTDFARWIGDQYPDLAQKIERKGTLTTPSTEPIQFMLQESVPIETGNAKGKRKAAHRGSSQRSTRSSEQAEYKAATLSVDGLCKERAKPRSKRVSPSATKNESMEDTDVDMRDFAQEAASSLPSQNPPVAGASTTGPSASAAEPEPGLAVVLHVLNDERTKAMAEYSEGKHKKHPDRITASSWQTKVYMACSMKEYAAKAEIFQYFASDLVCQLGPEWHESELYDWAKQHAKKKPTFEHISEQGILGLTRRQKMPQTTKREEKTLGEKGRPQSEHIGKTPRTGGKAAGLRPSLGGKKRLRDVYDEDDMDIDDGLPRRKTAKISQYFTDEEDGGQVADASSSEEEDQTLKLGSLTKIVIRTENVPSTTAKGPNHTWTCEEPDCGYVVRAANEKDGQDLIRLHFEQHEKEASDEAKKRQLSKINLAMQESRGHMPIKYAYFPPFLIKLHYLRSPKS